MQQYDYTKGILGWGDLGSSPVIHLPYNLKQTPLYLCHTPSSVKWSV